MYGPSQPASTPLKSLDGETLLTDKEDILNRWAEHFHSVLNRPSTINDEAIDRLQQTPINHKLDVAPSLPEVKKALHRIANGKAPGADSIPAEVLKHGGDLLLIKITELFGT